MTNATLAKLISGASEERKPDCATTETIHAWLIGELESGPAEQVRAHVTCCPFCSAEARLAGWFENPVESAAVEHIATRLREGLSGREGAEAIVAESISPPWASRWLPGGLAAAAMLLLVFGYSALAPPAVPELPSERVLRGGTVHLLEPSGDIFAAPVRVSWEGGTTDAYRVEFLAVDGETLWSSKANAPLPVPESAQQLFQFQVTYRVRVTPVDDAGEAIGQGAESEFRIVGSEVE